MKIFLDSSVTIAASMSKTGASHELFHLAQQCGWQLLVSPWVLRETRINLMDQPMRAAQTLATLRMNLIIADDELAFDWPIQFEASKDKVVLFSALAAADILLTLYRRDFGELLNTTVYG